MADFRISHISDLHLTRHDNDARSEPRILGALTGMNSNFRTLLASKRLQATDYLIVTGDVTDRGDLDAWDLFWKEIRGNGLCGRTLVILGNHDVCCLGLRIGLRPKLGVQDLKRAYAGLELGGQPSRFPWARQIHERIVLFGLESNNAGNRTALTNAVGEIGFVQLLALGNLLKRHSAIPIKVVALHHSPNIPGEQTAITRGQRPLGVIERLAMQMTQADRRALRVLCASHGVRLILHGHIHQAEDRRVNGLRIIGARATTEPLCIGNRQHLQYCEYEFSGRMSRLRSLTQRVPIGGF